MGFFGKEFRLNDKWFFADRKEKRKRIKWFNRDEKILRGGRSELVRF